MVPFGQRRSPVEQRGVAFQQPGVGLRRGTHALQAAGLAQAAPVRVARGSRAQPWPVLQGTGPGRGAAIGARQGKDEAAQVLGQHRGLFGLGHLVGQAVEGGETIAAGCS